MTSIEHIKNANDNSLFRFLNGHRAEAYVVPEEKGFHTTGNIGALLNSSPGFLNQIKDYQDLNKYYLILPTGSKKILSKFINISKFNIEEVNFQYLSKKYILRYLLSFLKESIILKKKLTLKFLQNLRVLLILLKINFFLLV